MLYLIQLSQLSCPELPFHFLSLKWKNYYDIQLKHNAIIIMDLLVTVKLTKITYR